MSTDRPPAPLLFGCDGLRLTDTERTFFTDSRPAGFILFARNCKDRDQVRSLVEDLRSCAGTTTPLILVDQEGGRVRRLGPPEWRAAPPAARFGDLATTDLEAAVEAVRLNTLLIAAELRELGINTDCAPVADLPAPDSHEIIGDRAFSNDLATLARLARTMADALLEAGVLPVVKHLPGHGRATADSHLDLPVVSAPRADLSASDFAVFRPLADLPLGMTAHVVYSALDHERPATTSPVVIEDVIRGEIGFTGLLMTDDLSMKALSGTMADRTASSLAAGCDLILHCNGDLDEMRDIAGAAPASMSVAAADRFFRATAAIDGAAVPDVSGMAARLDELMPG